MALRVGSAVTALLLISAPGSRVLAGQVPPPLHIVSSDMQQAFDSQLSAATNAMRAKGMSEKGISTVIAGMRSEQHDQVRIFNETAQKSREIYAAADAQPFNPARFEIALKRLRDNEVAAHSTAFSAQIAILHALSLHDQRIFAQMSYSDNRARLGMPARPMSGAH